MDDMQYFEDGYDSTIKHLWLNNIEGINVEDVIKLKQSLGNVWNIYDAGLRVIDGVVGEYKARQIIKSKSDGKIIELYDRLSEKGILMLYPERSQYPEKLRNIHNPPQLLYIKGRIKNCLNEYNKTIGVVGSRNPSTYGREICRYFSEKIAKDGFNIVSGLALGIDGIAHKAALDNGGYTVAVLGSGIDVAYPRTNIELYSRIVDNGAVISEYGLNVKPNPWQFPIRNRIISGLSDGVLIVEAKSGSGSLITAEHAAEQGRIVYAIPGRVMDKLNEGNNQLLREGAICATKPEDIIEDMVGISNYEKSNEKRTNYDKNNDCSLNENNDRDIDKTDNLTSDERVIIECLSLEPVYIDEILQKTHFGVTKTISLLYVLEDKGYIKQPDRGYYILYI
ncbi:MAG: DNA-processing protein DprA [Lachnospiraceae bacterium]|nr:DNA-processing protein DprA [Lachnospiraceae bacterium]